MLHISKYRNCPKIMASGTTNAPRKQKQEKTLETQKYSNWVANVCDEIGSLYI